MLDDDSAHATSETVELADDEDERYCWRIHLECGCTFSAVTDGPDEYPDDNGYQDPRTGWTLPLGQAWCWQHGRAQPPYRDILEWVHRKVVDYPEDPVEPPDGVDAEVWERIRADAPYSWAHWWVKLACGHRETVLTDVDWNGDEEPVLASTARVERIRLVLERHWAQRGADAWPEEGPERDHYRKMLDLHWPTPPPEAECLACSHVQQIVKYRRTGWLIPRNDPDAPAETADRRRLEARIKAAEVRMRRLRRQLAEADEDEGNS